MDCSKWLRIHECEWFDEVTPELEIIVVGIADRKSCLNCEKSLRTNLFMKYIEKVQIYMIYFACLVPKREK